MNFPREERNRLFGTKNYIFYVPNMNRFNNSGSSNGSRNRNSNRNRRGGRNNFRGRNGRGRGGRRGRNFKRGGKSEQKIDRSAYINETATLSEKVNQYEGKNYTDFDFHDVLSSNLNIKGFDKTTEIQELSIPHILDGKDILGISKTGSGKTGAFLIPMIQKMLLDNNQNLMVIAPTRELAQQIMKETISFVKGSGIYATLVVGGESIQRQISNLRRGSRIIIGTPGRINDLINRGEIKTELYNNVILDEVDRMLDMGFIGDITKIFEQIADERHSLFFSATHNHQIEKIVKNFINDYETIKLANNSPSKSVVQRVIDIKDKSQKISKLKELLNQDEVEKAIIFVETKRYADMVDKVLFQDKFRVGVIHGDKRQNQRRRILDKFKRSNINYLIATNVAARGIDIDDITHVINLDEPGSYDEYIHRIGRTGRNGRIGTAYTFLVR